MSRPWMPLYISDYRGDTARLTTVEHGAYLLLIMEYWNKGGLPDDDAELAYIVGLPEPEWLGIKAHIKRFFHDGWRHKRIDDELAKAEAAYEKRANAGRQGGLAKAASSNARAMPEPGCSIGYQPQPQPQLGLVPSLPTEVQEHSPKPPKRPRTKHAYPSEFEEFWSGYPTDGNMSKSEALKEWARLDPADRALVTKSLPAFRAYCQSHPDYRPVHASRYLSQRRFEGHAKTAERSAASSTQVRQETPQGRAWDDFYRVTKNKGVPWVNGRWNFPSEWPPSHHAEHGMAAE